MVMLQTAHARATSNDSLNRAFDNCVFLHDSLVNELTLAKELVYIDSLNGLEHQEYITILEAQIDELEIQKTQLNSIIQKQNKAIKSAERSAKRQKLKQNILIPTLSVISAGIGFAVGFYIPK